MQFLTHYRFARRCLFAFAACLILIFSLNIEISEAQYYDLDTIPSLDNQLNDLLYEPFDDDPEAIMNYFNLLRAYEAWTEGRRIRDLTPLVERIDFLTDKARAEMLMGTFLSLILEEYIVMESGVLPITETAIARLDSANSRLTEVIRYGVEGTERLYQMDADFTSFISDTLKSIREVFQYQGISTAVIDYNPRRIIINSYNKARKDYPSHVYRRSLAYWFYESIADIDEDEDESDSSGD